MDLEKFIYDKVCLRKGSMFEKDIESHESELKDKINNKSVLVIGGAGSIGSSFVKALLRFRPSTLVIVDINENALTELTRDLRSSKDIFVPEDYITYPMDFASETFEKFFKARKGFDIVANFSAHKHVRSEKDIYSIEALLLNNVIHARKLLELLSKYPPEEYFCVSTDKAANPVNIMGASKRIMEDLIFSYSDKFPVKTARFANVAFSNGSLPAGFVQRISKFQPLSAPMDVRRFFVSPEESGQICLLACILGNNREIFFPKLHNEQMMSFDEIALNLLKAYGYEADFCENEKQAIDKAAMLKEGSGDVTRYPVYFSKSDTSGEKMYEEFYTDDELVDKNRFSALGVVMGKEIPNVERIDELFLQLKETFGAESYTKAEIVAILKAYLPNFEHIETGKSLDSKM